MPVVLGFLNCSELAPASALDTLMWVALEQTWVGLIRTSVLISCISSNSTSSSCIGSFLYCFKIHSKKWDAVKVTEQLLGIGEDTVGVSFVLRNVDR